MDPESVSDILSRLSISSDDERRGILKSIGPLLEREDSREQLKPLLESSDLSILFDVLNSTDTDTIEVGCKVLKSAFQFLSPVIILSRYQRHLNRCLEHPNYDVKCAVLHLLTSLASIGDDNVASLLSQNETLLASVTRCIHSGSVSVGEQTSAFIVEAARLMTPEGNPLALSPPILPMLAEALDEKNEVVRMRVFDLIVRIAVVSPDLTQRVANEGFFQRLFVEVQNEADILCQLNAVEILTHLAESHHGFRYLETNQVLSDMDRMLARIAADNFADLVMPAFIKFFGRICHQCPGEFGVRFPNFYSLLQSVSDDDRSRLILVIETISYIGGTSSGRKAVSEIAPKIIQAIRKILNHGTDSEKSRVLSAYTDLVEYTDNESSPLCELFFNSYGGASDLMSRLTTLMKLPFSDLSSAAYDFLLKMSPHSWSLSKYNSFAGFFELLLSRDSAREKVPKELKYDLIRRISVHPMAGRVVPDHLLLRMQQYIREGPFYVETQPEVAFDGE